MNSSVETKIRSGVSAAIVVPLLAGLCAAAVCVALYWREAHQIETTLREREIARLGLFNQVLRHTFKETYDDLRILADGDGLRAYLSSGTPADLDRAVRRAAFFSREESGYDQVRYVDQNGQEILRVTQDGTIVPRDQLKNIADRGYFQKAMTLKPGEIYISTFDLDTENGRVVEPYQPMLRFASPVFDEAGKCRGAYIINYRGSNLIAGMQQLVPGAFRQRFRMLNAQGFWIKAATPEAEWGFMLSDRAGQTLARTDPALWSMISKEPEGQVRNSEGLFTWRRFLPGETIEGSHTKIFAGDEFLVLASEITRPEWSSFFTGLSESFWIIGSLLFLFVVMSARFFVLKERAVIELRKSSQQIQSTNEKLRQANEELESFSYSVSHDLRAPLRHIDGFVDRLGKMPSVLADDKSKRYLGVISQSARHMGNLIDDLLVFSRMGRAEMREAKVNLEQMVNDVIAGMAEDIKQRNIVFNVHNLPVVQGDPPMLQQVLVNLIGNAVKYTRTRERAQIEITAAEAPGEIVVSVRDNGVGFDMEYAHKLFGVFQRLHRAEEFEGTGIGLANVRRIIQRHGGRTWAEGKVNEGATSYFSLPRKKETHESIETHPAR